jgi:hypothetical protein
MSFNNWLPEPSDFDNPTPALILWLQKNLQYYRELGDEDAINLFRTLLENAQKKNPMIIRSVDGRMFKTIQEYPAICTKQCPNAQCSSWGTITMEGKPCRNRVPTNEEIKHPQPEIIMRNTEAEDKAILQSIPRNSKLGSIMDRLEKIEEQVVLLEKEPEKAIELFHVIPRKPNFFKPRNPDGTETDEE